MLSVRKPFRSPKDVLGIRDSNPNTVLQREPVSFACAQLNARRAAVLRVAVIVPTAEQRMQGQFQAHVGDERAGAGREIECVHAEILSSHDGLVRAA